VLCSFLTVDPRPAYSSIHAITASIGIKRPIMNSIPATKYNVLLYTSLSLKHSIITPIKPISIKHRSNKNYKDSHND